MGSMTNIRQRLQQDLSTSGQPLLKKVLQDHQLTPTEYNQLKNHYAGRDPQKQAEFEVAFKDFSYVNFGISKSFSFASKPCVFPDLPKPIPAPQPLLQTSKPQQKESSPQVIIPKEAFRMDARKYVQERNFWAFMKTMDAAPKEMKAEFISMLNTTMSQMEVASEKDYQFVKNVMQNAKSMVKPGYLKNLVPKMESYEIFTGKTPGVQPVLGAGQIDKYLQVMAQSVKGPQTNLFGAQGASVSEFTAFLGRSTDPELTQGGTVYERWVNAPRGNGQSSCVDALSAKLVAYPGKNLDPADVLKMALEVTNGNLPLANLTVHNLFKYIAYNGRPNASFQNASPHNLRSGDYLKIVDKLGSLRPSGSKSTDKMGPWYHFFGLQTAASAYKNSSQAEKMLMLEHASRSGPARFVRQAVNAVTSRTIGVHISDSPTDTEKAKADEISLAIARRYYK
jgi:hypothetical protein